MAKILMLKHNKEWKKQLDDNYYKIKNPIKELKESKRKNPGNCGDWLRVRIPALYGADSGKGWVKAMKRLATV